MTDRQRRTRIGVLIGAHLVLGMVVAPLAMLYPQLQNETWISVLYLGFVCTEILLVGIWLGLSAARWRTKLGGLLVGAIWLGGLSVAPVPFRSFNGAPILLVLVGVPLLVVAASCALCRRTFAKLECRDRWKSRPVSEELQFSLRSLIGLTVIISALLGLARCVRWIDPGAEFMVVILMFALTALLATGMLVWASLGLGLAFVRVPIVLAAMTLLGLLPPYSMEYSALRYIVWPSLMAVVAACTAGSLLVIRSCGYRLVRLRSEVDTPTDSATRSGP
jgi:hypothetical protein